MTCFEETAVCRASALVVWKLLYDPNRFVDWWSGVVRSETRAAGAVIRTESDPDFEVPLRMSPLREGSGVMMRCLVTDTVWIWGLEPHPQGCLVRMRLEVSAADEDLVISMHASMLASLPRLVSAAEHADAVEAGASPPGTDSGARHRFSRPARSW